MIINNNDKYYNALFNIEIINKNHLSKISLFKFNKHNYENKKTVITNNLDFCFFSLYVERVYLFTKNLF